MEIPAAVFKAKCLQIMDSVARSGKSVVITKRGKPVAKLVPPDKEAPRAPLFGRMSGTVLHEGDLVSPVDADWEILSTHEPIRYGDAAKKRGVHRVADGSRKSRR